MSGLFTRLAQQSIMRDKPCVTPAREPIFQADVSGAPSSVIDPQLKSDQGNKTTELSNKSRLGDTGGEADHAPSIDLKTREIEITRTPRSDNNNSKHRSQDTNTPSVIKPLPRDTAVITKNPESVSSKHEASLGAESTFTDLTNQLQPRSTKHSPSAQPDKESESDQGSAVHPTENASSGIMPHPSVAPKTDDLQFVSALRYVERERIEVQQSLSRAQETVINISIGQIDIKATTQESTVPKKAPKSNRSPSASLEEYQTRRARGDR